MLDVEVIDDPEAATAASYIVSPSAPAAAARDEPLWQEWVKELFPPPAVASDIAC